MITIIILNFNGTIKIKLYLNCLLCLVSSTDLYLVASLVQLYKWSNSKDQILFLK